MIFRAIRHWSDHQQNLAMYLHEMISSTQDLELKLKFNLPFYYRKTWVCYINKYKKDGVELAFPRGFELSQEHELLSSKGRKMVKGIALFSISEFQSCKSQIQYILNEAVLLDDMIPYRHTWFKSS